MEQYKLSPLLPYREKVFALLFPHPVYIPHPNSKWPVRRLSHSLYPGYKSELRTPVQRRFSLELAHCSNNISHSNKLYFFLILSHIWKFFSNPCLDHDRAQNFWPADTTFMAESEEELKSLLKVKEKCKKAGLKLNIQKTEIMASGPITSWQIDGETMEIVTDFIFLVSKIAADGDCNHEIKRCLFLGKKAMTNLDSILKSKDIILLTKVCTVKVMVFPVVMYGCES